MQSEIRLALPMNRSVVAADFRRRTLLGDCIFRLLTSAAVVKRLVAGLLK